MSTVSEQEEEHQDPKEHPHYREGTRVPWFVMLGLVLVLGGIALASSTSKTKPSNPGERAVLVPTDRVRTVVVTPCATGVPLTASNAASAQQTDGAITIRLAAGEGLRTVLVPRCTAKAHSTQAASSNLPSAAFVLPVGAKGPSAKGGQGVGISENIEAQLVLPQGSTATTIVVPPCERSGGHKKSGSGRVVVLGPLGGRSGLAVAPSC
jgi:hypothetical protein